MKPTKQTVLIFLLMLMANMGKAQEANEQQDPKLWLLNNEGKRINTQNKTVSRSYFTAKWIDIQTEMPLATGARYMVIIQPLKAESHAEALSIPRISKRIISKLSNAASGTIITVLIEDPKTKNVTKAGGILQFIIE